MELFSITNLFILLAVVSAFGFLIYTLIKKIMKGRNPHN